MTQDGFKLTLPDGTVFECTEEVDVTARGETQFFIEGLQQILGFWETFIDNGGQSGKGDSQFQTLAVGVGGGIHRIEIQFLQYKNSGDTWGSFGTSNAEARTLMQELERSLTTTRVDSTQPADLEVNQYSGSGTYNAIPVVIESFDLPHRASDGEDTSSFRGSLTFIEAADLEQAIDNTERRTDR